MQRTKIGWTDSADSKASKNIMSDIMATDKTAGPVVTIEAVELSAATTRAVNDWIWFIRSLPFMMFAAVLCAVVQPRRQDLKILRTVVRLIAVGVMNDLVLAKSTMQHLLRDKAVLIYISAAVRFWVLRALDQYIAIRGNSSPALPVGIACTLQLRHDSV